MRRNILSGALLLAIGLHTGCTRAVFQSNRETSPQFERARGTFEPVNFSSADGTRLTGMFFPAAATPVKGTVVHFHGNSRNMTAHYPYSRWLTRHGFQVFVFDYRGFGASAGRSTLRGAVQDGIAAIAYARTRSEDPGNIFILGQSLGGAIALGALADMGAPGVRAAAIEGSFSSFKEIVRMEMAKKPALWAFQWPLSRLLFFSRYDPKKSLARLGRLPVVVIHGTADPIVPLTQAEALFAAAHGPKELWQVDGGGHLHAFTRAGVIYQPKLAEFFSRAAAPRSESAP